MYKVEKILVGVITLSILMLMASIPGASALLILSASTLSSIYLVLGFLILRDRESKKQNVALSIVASLVFSMVLTAMLFKLMLWPGSIIIFYSSIIPTTVIFFICLSLKNKSENELSVYYKAMFVRASIALGLIVIVLITPPSTFYRILYLSDATKAKLAADLVEKNDPESREAYTNYMRSKRR